MKIIYFATSNDAKISYAKRALKPFGISVRQLRIELIESRSENPAEIALEKAKQAYKEFRKPLIVEDSGFFIHALNGFPKTHVKFSIHTLGLKNIMKMMSGLKNRKAHWQSSVAYIWAPNKYKVFTFIEAGEIAKSIRPIRRNMMSDWWRIYIPKMVPENSQTLSEMSEEMRARNLKYQDEHNHLMIFGEWLAKQSS